MSRKFKIRSRFEAYGAFWDPRRPEAKFTGRLVRHSREIELTTSPIYELIQGAPMLFDERLGTVGVLHGFTTLGPCTLLLLQPLGGGYADLPSRQSLDFNTYHVGLCIIGLHIPDADSDCLTSSRLSYSGLQEWNRQPPIILNTPEETRFSHSKSVPSVFDVCSTDLKCRLVFELENHIEMRASGEYSSLNESVLTIQPSEPKSLRWFMDVAYRFESFFSILLGSSSSLVTLGLACGDKGGWLTREAKNRIEKADRSVWIVCNRKQLQDMALQWVSTPKEFQPFEDLVYGTIRNSSLSSQTEFLSLAQALEAFHRLTDTSTLVDAHHFSSVQRSLRASIETICGESELAQRLCECIQHANEITFQARIKKLILRLSERNRQLLLGDTDDFEQTLRQTRNYLTHPGIKKQAKVLTGARELFFFNLKMHALLRLLVLMRLGLPEEAGVGPVQSQVNRWRLPGISTQ